MLNQTKDKIMQVAFEMFAVNGYESTALSEIAARIGVTKPALYTYFKGKEELLLSIYEKVELEYKNYMHAVLKNTEAIQAIEEKLFYIFEQYVKYFKNNIYVSAFWIRIVFFPPPSLRDKFEFRMLELETSIFEKMKEIFMEGITAGIIRDANVDELMLSFYCMREGLLMVYSQNMGKPAPRDIWRNFWLGIRGPGVKES